MIGFGYIPDYKNKNKLLDFLFRIIGYPYLPKRMEAQKTLKLLKIKKSDKILDIGCGDGLWTNFLKMKGYNIIGIDPSKQALGIAKKRAKLMGINNVCFFGDARKMKFKSNSFDKIFSTSVFEHIQNDDKAFKESFRVLKKGGFFSLSVAGEDVPFFTNFLVKLPKKIKKKIGSKLMIESESAEDFKKKFDKKYCHYQVYNEEFLIKKAEKTGFKVIKIKRVVGTFTQLAGIFHFFKIFNLNKSYSLDYSLKTKIAYALITPLILLTYILDSFLPKTRALSLVMLLKKE